MYTHPFRRRTTLPVPCTSKAMTTNYHTGERGQTFRSRKKSVEAFPQRDHFTFPTHNMSFGPRRRERMARHPRARALGPAACGDDQALGLSSSLRRILGALSTLHPPQQKAVQVVCDSIHPFSQKTASELGLAPWHAASTGSVVHLPQAGSPIRFSVCRIVNDLQFVPGICCLFPRVA